jgi:hypothetical protein
LKRGPTVVAPASAAAESPVKKAKLEIKAESVDVFSANNVRNILHYQVRNVRFAII